MNSSKTNSIMKKRTTLRTAFTLLLAMMTIIVMALPKQFEGIITYKITYPGSTFTEAQMAMFPKIMTITIKGQKTISEIQTQMGSQVEITNYETKTKTQLINMMGQKYAIPQTNEEIQEEVKDQPEGEVQITDETKTIAGYSCKKAIVTVNDAGTKITYEVWFSEEFGAENPNFDNPIYKNINGVMMEFSMITPQFTMKFTAISVDKKKISNKTFNIPADYTVTTMEELRSKMGGMR